MTGPGRLTAGQVLVTDPSAGDSSGGYQLVAATPDVAPDVLDHLERHPGVSDHLHRLDDEAAAHATFLSFFPLPAPHAGAGAPWAFSRRFLRGKRRGSYNRVFAHTLVLAPEVLEALGWDPWLLLGRDRLRRGGETVTFARLADDLAGPPFAPDLPEVEIVPPPDPFGERLQALERRRRFLAGVLAGDGDAGTQEGVDALAAHLDTCYRALARDRNLVLPQGAEGEQLLALVWSSLPRRDRLATPWTTHLGPGEGHFRLAASPSPENLRGWMDLDRPPPRVAATDASPGEWAELIAAGTAGHEPAGDEKGEEGDELLEAVLEGAEREDHGISLTAERGVPAAGWIAFCRAGGRIPPDGFPDAATLESTLARFDLAAGDNLDRPWLGATTLLESAAATVRNEARRRAAARGGGEAEGAARGTAPGPEAGAARRTAGARAQGAAGPAGGAADRTAGPTADGAATGPVDGAADRAAARAAEDGADRVAEALERLRIGERVARPEILEELAGHAPDRAPWAAALVVRRLSSEEGGGRAALEHLDARMEALTAGAGTAPEDPLLRGLLRDLDARLAARLLELRSPRLRQALERALTREEGLEAVHGHLERSTRGGPTRDPSLLFALLDMAALVGDGPAARSNRAAASKIARQHLVPALARPETAEETSTGEIDLVLDALQRTPVPRAGAEGLAQALRSWDGKAFDRAAGRLRTAPRQDPDLVRDALRSVLTLAAGTGPPLLPHRRSRLGLAETLDGLGAEPDLWVPFALDEAAYLDEAGTPEDRAAFRDFCARLDLTPARSGDRPAARAASLFLEGLGGGTGRDLGEAHRALFTALIPGCVAWPLIARQTVEERILAAPEAAAVPLRAAWSERLAEWAPVVLDLATALQGAGTREGETVAHRWWKALGEAWGRVPAGRGRVPAEAVDLLRRLAPGDRRQVVQDWLRRIPDLPEDQEGLLDAFAETARTDPHLHFAFYVSRTGREVRLGRLDLVEAAAGLDPLAWRAGSLGKGLAAAWDRLLSSRSSERVPEILELLGSPRVWPTGKQALACVLETTLETALDSGGEVISALPDLERFASHPLAPLHVGAFLGARWKEEPKRATALLAQALDLECRPFLRSFLRSAGWSGRRGLLRHLHRERDLAILRRLERAVRKAAHWDLHEFEGQLAADPEGTVP